MIKGAGEWGPAATFPDTPEIPTTEVSILVRDPSLAARGHLIAGRGIEVNVSDVVFMWGGVNVNGQANATFDHVQFLYVMNHHGLEIEDSSAFAVRDSEFVTQVRGFSDVGVNIINSIGVVERSYIGAYFDHPISIARYPDGPITVVTVDDVDIEGSPLHYADGIRMFGRPSVTILNSRITRSVAGAEAWRGTGSDGAAAGIQVQNTTAGITGNRVEIIGNTISGFDVGINIDVSGYTVKVEDNDISGESFAVHIADYYGLVCSPAVFDFGGGRAGSVGGSTFNPPDFGFTFFVDDIYDIDACFNDWVVPDSSVDPSQIWDKLDESFRGRVYWDVCARESLVVGTPVPTLAAILPETAEPPPSATALRNAPCREGTDPDFDVHNFLFEGEIAKLIGRMAIATWFYVELPNDLGRCWVFSENLELGGEIGALPLYTPPELPAADDEGGEEGSEGDSGGGNGGDGGGNNDGGRGGSAPDAPSNLSYQCTGSGFEFTISWNDNSDNEDGFRILLDGSEAGSVGSNVNQFTHNPSGSGPYSVTIEAYNGNGTGKATIGNVGCLP